jgi:magnesium-protoporphyrin O-methyltransferase
MPTASFAARRGQLETYFDRTASAAWIALTSDVKVSGVRATVRAGRDRMRETLLSWLPDDLTGQSVLDCGCGTGALAIACAARGATVTAIDVAPNLIAIAQSRSAETPAAARIDFRVGDMLSPTLGAFDHIVLMDSLIHYELGDVVDALAALRARARASILFTIAPRTPALALMHVAGRLFPKADRAPAIVPIAPDRLAGAIAQDRRLDGFALARQTRIASGFYTSQAIELAPA